MGAEFGLQGGLQGELVQEVGQRDGGRFVAGEDLVERFGGDDFFSVEVSVLVVAAGGAGSDLAPRPLAICE